MDSTHKDIIKQNETLFKNIDIKKLKPFITESKIFTKSMLNDIYDSDSEYTLYSELPTRGPKAYSLFLTVLNKAQCDDEFRSLLNNNKGNLIHKKENQEFYPMKCPPLGYCLIINNVNFEHEDYRHGSDVDVKNLHQFFEKIGYHVEILTDLKGNKIKRYLSDFSKNKMLKSVYCLFVVILSHGSNIRNLDVIHGTDGVAVYKKEDIIDVFNNVNCENLKMKPKVFIFQACRGGNEDEGVYSTVSADAVKVTKHPSVTDILVIHSSLPFQKAYRDHFEGSWLIQDMLSVFSEKYLYEDLDNMLRSIDKKVQSRVSKEDNKQVLHIEKFGFKANFHICSNDEYKGSNISERTYLYYV